MPEVPEPTPSALHKWVERDRSLARAMHRATVHPSVLLMSTLASWLGNGKVWYTTLLALPWVGGPNGTACALRMLLLGAVNLLIYGITKRHFARARPFVACPGVRACVRCLDEYSFPSGHTMHAVAFGTPLSAYYPAFDWILWPFAAMVAASRVVLGLHFPSDVLVGAALGWLMARLVLSGSEQPNPARGPGVPEETTMPYKVNGNAEMTDTSLVRARGVIGRRGASPSLSMVGESSVTLVSGASRIPF